MARIFSDAWVYRDGMIDSAFAMETDERIIIKTAKNIVIFDASEG